MESTGESVKPTIRCLENGPYRVEGLENLSNSKGESLAAKPAMSLCRCGGSANKPFCDGTHKTNGFSSAKQSDGGADRRDDYVGQSIAIHDNRSVCSHAGYCSDTLAAVFRLRTEPWIDPDAANPEEIIAAVKRCPSGALSYSAEGVEHRDQDRDAQILVSKDGPLYVTGGIELVDESPSAGASEEHYALCRCGGSKNKPFCDGTHWSLEFKDDNN